MEDNEKPSTSTALPTLSTAISYEDIESDDFDTNSMQYPTYSETDESSIDEYEQIFDSEISRNERKRKRKENDEVLISDDEIDAMLEESLNKVSRSNKKLCPFSTDYNETKNTTEDDPQNYHEIEKIVLVERNRDHFDILPEGWIKVTHNSGLNIYLNKITRVCSLSRPYFLGTGSTRKHQIPLSAIPCLNYRKALEAESEEKNERSHTWMHSGNNNEIKMEIKTENENESALKIPYAKIETVQENNETRSLTHEQIRDYCSNLFEFKTIKVMKFKSWSNRRRFVKKKKLEKCRERPTLPQNTKLITFPIYNEHQKDIKREWIMNPTGKSYVCILHEYVQHVLKKQPSYKFSELENPSTPYSATVFINNMRYGVGYGSSKRSAKSDAARITLEILIPEMKDKIISAADHESNNINSVNNKLLDDDLTFFDDIKIDDPRVSELCSKTTEPSPHAILLTCLQRNHGLGDTVIKFEGSILKHQKNQFTMTVGKHSATVVCKNKREGKQLASQGILKALHPNLKSWGSILRLYGSRSIKSFKEKKLEEQEITLLQNKATENSPNYAILNKLKSEMLKIYDNVITRNLF